MLKKQLNFFILTVFIIGVVFGYVGSNFVIKPVIISVKGVAMLDTATHEDPYLSNAIVINRPILDNDLIYLQFQNNTTMNATIGKNVLISGELNNTALDSGQQILQLNVTNVEQLKN